MKVAFLVLQPLVRIIAYLVESYDITFTKAEQVSTTGVGVGVGVGVTIGLTITVEAPPVVVAR